MAVGHGRHDRVGIGRFALQVHGNLVVHLSGDCAHGDFIEHQQAQLELDRLGVFILARIAGAVAAVGLAAARAADDPARAGQRDIRLETAHHHDDVLHFLAEQLSIALRHFLLLLHQAVHLRVVAVQADAARRHPVGDVLAPLGVIRDADVAQVEGLLEIERILVPSGAGGENRHEIIAIAAFDVLLGLPREVAGNHVQLTGNHRMHRVVVVGRNRLTLQTLEIDDGNGLVRLAVIIGAFPPGSAFGVE